MYYLIAFLLTSLLVFGGIWVKSESLSVGESPAPATITQNTQATPEPTAQVLGIKVSEPSRIVIPKIGVDAPVEGVGMDADERMDVPKDSDNAGWFDLGIKPGEKGNAVMAGHLDKITGAPAIFWRLSELEVGDEIKSYDKDGKELTFKVSEKKVYPYNEVPLEYVFGDSDKRRLNLITCNGNWNRGASNYSHRMVVYSELVQ